VEFASLNTFLAVAESGSFSLAAERLFLTQPAVSKRIAALESDLGQALFDRIGHQIRLTEAGRTLLPRARAMLDALADTRRTLANLDGHIAGPLHFATSHHIGLHRLAPLLRHFHQTYPEVELAIDFLASEEAIRRIQHGELELAVITLPPQAPPQLICTPIWNDPLEPAVARDHPLASIHSLTLETLTSHPAILPEPDTYTREVIDQALAPNKANVLMQTNYLETIKMLVTVGLGWSLLPSRMLGEGLIALPVEGLHLTRPLGIARHRGHTLSNAAAAFIQWLEQEQT